MSEDKKDKKIVVGLVGGGSAALQALRATLEAERNIEVVDLDNVQQIDGMKVKPDIVGVPDDLNSYQMEDLNKVLNQEIIDFIDLKEKELKTKKDILQPQKTYPKNKKNIKKMSQSQNNYLKRKRF